jgi:hypothetical protein
MNGALAIADVLGIFGREDLYYAAYWREPPADSPGYYALKAYTNFDDQGGRFGDLSVWSQTENPDLVSSYAALDSKTGALHLMLLNKRLDTAMTVAVDVEGFAPGSTVAQYQMSAGTPTLGTSTFSWDAAEPVIELPAYSVTHLIWQPAPP